MACNLPLLRRINGARTARKPPVLSSFCSSAYSFWPRTSRRRRRVAASRSRLGWRLAMTTMGLSRGEPRMKQFWHPDELARDWTLSRDEHALLANKTGATRLGFAVLL